MCLDPRFSCPNQRPSRNKRVFPRVFQRFLFSRGGATYPRRMSFLTWARPYPEWQRRSRIRSRDVMNQRRWLHGACRRLFHSIDRFLVVVEARLSLLRTCRSWFSSPRIVLVLINRPHLRLPVRDESDRYKIVAIVRIAIAVNMRKDVHLKFEIRVINGRCFQHPVCIGRCMWHVILSNDNGAAMNNFILANDGLCISWGKPFTFKII